MRRVAHNRLVLGLLLSGLPLVLAACMAGSRVTQSERPGCDEVTCGHTGLTARLTERLANPDPNLPMLPDDYSAPDAPRPMVACYSRENPPPPEVIKRMQEEMFGLALQYQLGTRWSSTSSGPTGSPGNPVTITWSLVPDGLSLPASNGDQTAPSVLFARMDQLFGGNRALWIQRISDGLNRWSQVSGVTYVRIRFAEQDWDDGASWGTNGFLGRRGDVRIGMKNIDGPGGILAYNGFPPQGDMVLDAADSWATPANNHRFMRNIIAHENGHGMGLFHTCPEDGSKVMEPSLATNFDGPQQDDIRAMQRHYGDVFEGDDTAAVARDVGTLGPSSTLNLGAPPTIIPSSPTNITVPAMANASSLSIDRDGEQDWMKFTLTRPLLVGVTLTPVGTTYDNQPQGDECPEGNPVNALNRANLRFHLIDIDGFTVARAADANLAGQPESVTQVLLPGRENLLRITENNTPTETQLYRVTITTGAGLNFTASDGTFLDRVALSWSAIPGNLGYKLFRGTTTNRADAVQIGPATIATTTFNDTTAVRGTTYFYWVQTNQIAEYAVDFGGPEQGFVTPPPPCLADFNNDGARDPDDLADFITCFFLDVQIPGFCAGADFNHDGNRDPDDLADFITTFFIGCP